MNNKISDADLEELEYLATLAEKELITRRAADVKPHVQREFVNELCEISRQYGKTQQLRAHFSKAVTRFLSGITVNIPGSDGNNV